MQKEFTMEQGQDFYAFKKVVLPSGATVFLKHLPYATKVNIGMLFKVGGRDGTPGASHFLEHVSSSGRRSEIKNSVKNFGGNISLGATKRNSTFFKGYVPPGEVLHLVNALGRLVDRPVFTDKELELEKSSITVEVFSEIPYPELEYRITKEYLKNETAENYSFLRNGVDCQQTLGTIKQINAITREDLNNHYEKYYRANNLFIFVTGNFKESSLLQILQTKVFAQEADYSLEIKRNSFPIDKDFVPFAEKRILLPCSKFGNGGSPPATSSISWGAFVSRKFKCEVMIFREMFYEALFELIRGAYGGTYTPTVDYESYEGGLHCFGRIKTTQSPSLVINAIEKALATITKPQTKELFEKVHLQFLKRYPCLSEDSGKILTEAMNDFSNLEKIESTAEAALALEKSNFETFQKFVKSFRESMQIRIFDKDL